MAKILHKQKNKDETETIVFPNEENSLECIMIVGKPPRVHKIYVVPNDKRTEVLSLIFEGKKIPEKYLDKPNEEKKPKKIDVVEEMDRIERRESLEEGREKKP